MTCRLSPLKYRHLSPRRQPPPPPPPNSTTTHTLFRSVINIHSNAPTTTTTAHSFPSDDHFVYDHLLLQTLSNRDLHRARYLLDHTPHSTANDAAVVRWTSILSRFAQHGFMDEARSLFELMPCRNLVTWNAMLSTYVRSGQIDSAREIFLQMPCRNVVSWTSMLCGLARSGRVAEARDLFDSMPRRNVVSWNTMIAGLVRSGEMESARELFEEMPKRTRVSYNTIISGYAEVGEMGEARRLFEGMMAGRGKNVETSPDVVTWSTMITGYCRKGEIEEAYELFRAMVLPKNVVTWTAMIGGFTWNGYYADAVRLFLEMKRTATDVVPNLETSISLLYACSGLGLRFCLLGKQAHAHLLVAGAISMDGGDCGGRLLKGLILMYCKFRLVDWAHHIFSHRNRRCRSDTVCLNSLIESYGRVGQLEEARQLFDDSPFRDEITWTVMISVYLDGGNIGEALRLFERMPFRDEIVWTEVICGFVQNELISEALDMFKRMLETGVRAVDHTLAALLGAAGSIACLRTGEVIHGLLVKSRPDLDTILNNAIISMYAKCGDMVAAMALFKRMASRDVVSWNSVIMGLAHHGLAAEALRLFQAMQETGARPDSVTYLAALSACAHANMVDRGTEIFGIMVGDSSVTPGVEHYACMVDLLGRAGKVAEAEKFASELPFEPGVPVWGMLLGMCGVKGGEAWGVGERAAQRVMEMDPANAAAHLMLCRMHAEGERYSEGEGVREEMGWKGVRKTPGLSWVVLKGRPHVFLCGD